MFPSQQVMRAGSPAPTGRTGLRRRVHAGARAGPTCAQGPRGLSSAAGASTCIDHDGCCLWGPTGAEGTGGGTRDLKGPGSSSGAPQQARRIPNQHIPSFFCPEGAHPSRGCTLWLTALLALGIPLSSLEALLNTHSRSTPLRTAVFSATHTISHPGVLLSGR